MSLLSICQDAATDVGVARMATVIGNPEVDVQRLLRFAARVGSDLVTRAPWQRLRAVRNFTATATEVQANAVPADFLRFSPETVWDTTNGLSLTGPIDPVEYQSRRNEQYSTGYAGPMRWFTRRADDFLVWPVPMGGENYAFEYQSGAYCQSAAGVPQTVWAADTDTGRISEELITLGVIARFLSADQQPSGEAMAAYERRLRMEIQNDAPMPKILPAGDVFGTGRRFTGEPGAPIDGGGGSGGGGWVWG